MTCWNRTSIALEIFHVLREQGKYSMFKLTDSTEGLEEVQSLCLCTACFSAKVRGYVFGPFFNMLLQQYKKVCKKVFETTVGENSCSAPK